MQASPAKPPPPPDRSKLERDIRAAVRRHAQRQAAADEAAGARDRVIRDAQAAGFTPAQLAEITGLSKQRLDQIRREKRL